MVGPASLRTKKGLVTRYSNNLRKIIDKVKDSRATQGEASNSPAPSIEATVFELQTSTKLLSEALNDFTAALDTIDNLPEEQEAQTEQYIDASVDLIDEAQRLAMELEKARWGERDENMATESAEMATPKLPAIPIPVFSGKIWEFSNFWTLFNAHVHARPLPNLMKFNYLVDSLRGEARELIRRYPVTATNYDHAVKLLRDKYGNESTLIANLQSRLEMAKAEKPTIPSQRRLLEYILPIVTQLEDLGISLDGSYLTRKLLAKFSPDLQRKVLETQLPQNKQESDWVLRNVLSELDNLITTEEQIHKFVDDNTHSQRQRNEGIQNNARTPFKKITATKLNSSDCMFCKSPQHKSATCTKVTNISARRDIMLRQNRCLNCGREGHFVKDCRSEGCKTCRGAKHHHTLCPQRQTNATAHSTQTNRGNVNHNGSQQRSSPTYTRRNAATQQTSSTSNVHPLHTEALVPNEQESTDTAHTIPGETAILQNIVIHPTQGKVMLLTGTARVRDEVRDTWKEVEILFDTGADQSFISLALADELKLQCTQQQGLLAYTFGRDSPRATKCGVTTLEIWDDHGEKHPVRLCTTPVLIGSSQTIQLSQEDLAFVSRHNIKLSKRTDNLTSKPEILLGCDQLWNLLEAPLPQFSLPSGLQLIPSKLGYLLSGKQRIPQRKSKQHEEAVNTNTVSMINVFPDIADELTRWDKYWTMDSAGICEFTGTKNAEKAAINTQVETFFKNTIERRDDGYYVRLPYIDNHPPLPDNKQIALKRLQGVITMLSTNPELLDNYNSTFQTQLEKGIIEEIGNNTPGDGPITHYIPHQPVLTPHKETTKLRIVFDASSHYKGCPSLNDILHQGPLVLPDIYAMLIRFRLQPYASTSDVEKAFLQVRLHELDRDATRFLWVRNVKSLITEDNIITYRFTRVTFGLNVSPFLLAATIYHHLNHAVQDQNLAQEIKSNLYVDNLILSASSPDELQYKVSTSRLIFEEMKMNLREFMANHVNLQEVVPEDTCAKTKTQKVLGMIWNAENDVISIHCCFPTTKEATKRTIAHQIASIYDPLGLLVPLLTQAKHFQQTLWKHNLKWDSILPNDLQMQWETIRNDADGFNYTCPRQLLQHSGDYNIAVFADASEIAIAACAYAFNETQSTLVMAKCKLPSIRTTMTMPKLEMNALTMAARLSWSVCEAVKAEQLRIPKTPSTVFIFSDSQIALSWLSSTPKKSNPGVLVSNRLKEIRRITQAFKQNGVSVRFAYVNTRENPADVGTRGVPREQLRDHFWWSGPKFLRTPINEWTNTFYPCEPEQLQESSQEVALNTVTSSTPDFDGNLVNLQRFSSFKKALRTTAYILIFIKKILRPLSEKSQKRIYGTIPELRSMTEGTPALQATDIRNARFMLIRNHQSTHLTKTYRKTLENSLRPYLDPHKIWRSKGRLNKSDLDDEAKAPAILAPNTDLARLIIQEAHGTYHRGVEHTISTVRQNYWIPKIRQQTRKLVHKCVKCRRFNGHPFAYPDATDLPERRVCRSRPFQHIGLDFFDLPTTSEEQGNSRCYGCIFTCTVTRLLHLEMLDSMSTIDFINALRRFVARRGVPDSITCDNAPTFLLGSSILSNSPQENDINSQLGDVLAGNEIQWKHITPYAPWQGGFYERLIKSVKHALYKALRGAAHRSGDHLRTILTEIEACLNSRPLTYQGAEREDLVSVRPADFLQKDFNITLPQKWTAKLFEDDAAYLPPEEMRALQTRQEVLDALEKSCEATEKFWRIWTDQYLTSLRETHKKSLTDRRHTQLTPKQVT